MRIRNTSETIGSLCKIDEGLSVSVFGEISKWAVLQDPAIKEVFLTIAAQNGYSEEDVVRLCELLKIEESLIQRTPQSPTYSEVPKEFTETPAPNKSIVLKKVHEITNVTTIKNGTEAPFIHEGVTVIYGENGAGKSGIARILKQACRARKVDKVLSNVYVSGTPIPTAKINVEVDGNDKPISWQDGKFTIDELAQISVFDSKCALVQIDNSNQLFFAPKGSEIFLQMVRFLTAAREKLEGDKKPASPPILSKQYSVSNETSRTLSKIDTLTSVAQLDSVLTWSTADEEALVKQRELKAATNEEVNRKKQTALQQKSSKVAELEGYLKKAEEILSQEKLATYSELHRSFENKRDALNALSKTLSAQTQLPDVGGDIWRELYLAAKKYSEASVYKDKTFPWTQGTAVCVLCEQVFAPEAAIRMQSFEKLMEGVIKQDFDSAKTALEKSNTYLREKFSDSLKIVSALYTDVQLGQENFPSDESEKVKALIDALLAAGKTAADPDVSKMLHFKSELLPVVNALKSSIAKEISDLAEALKPEKLAAISTTLGDLEYRKEVSGLKDKYVAYLEAIIHNRKIEACQRKVGTTTVSKAGNKIISAQINSLFAEQVREELKALGAKKIPLKLSMSGDAGTVVFDLQLDQARLPRTTKLSDILSEGEVKVVSLAVFLAEVGIGQDKHPIVLDDPVTSLDHRYREKIAERLVVNAIERQVIIFTHDISFVAMVEKNCLQREVPLYVIAVKKDSESSEVSNETPWNTKAVQERIVFVRTLLANLKTLESTLGQETYNLRAGEIYGLLRETWERFVEEVLLYKVVSRFGYEVKTQRLKGVEVTNDDFKVVFWAMSKCSRWMVGHDDSLPVDSARPKTDEIEKDIEDFATHVRTCKARNAKLDSARAELVEKPATASIG